MEIMREGKDDISKVIWMKIEIDVWMVKEIIMYK